MTTYSFYDRAGHHLTDVDASSRGLAKDKYAKQQGYTNWVAWQYHDPTGMCGRPMSVVPTPKKDQTQ